MLPHIWSCVANTSNLLKEGVSWKMLSVLCCFKELSIWHLPEASTHTFENISNLLKEGIHWKMFSTQCFKELSTLHFPYISKHTFANTSNLLWDVSWRCFLHSALSQSGEYGTFLIVTHMFPSHSNLVIKGAGWKMLSPQCCSTMLSIWHFPFISTHTLQTFLTC